MIVDPGDEPERLLEAADAAGRRDRGDPDHALPLRPHRRRRAGRARDRRARVLPGDRAAGARRHHELGAARVRAVRELRGRAHASPGGERLQLAGLRRSRCCSRPGHSPGPRHLREPPREPLALLSGDVLFQGSVGRVDLPGGDWATLERSIGEPAASVPGRDRRLPRPHGRHDARARARHQPVPQRAARSRPARAGGAGRRRPPNVERRQAQSAARHVRRARRAGARARATLEARARAILEGAGYERIETPTFEATELFARGVGESTDIVQQGDVHASTDGGGRSLTLRPEGTAPVCRAYVEHGMHKRRQPVKLWYLSSFFRHERAQAGPLPAVLAGRRGGARLRGPRRRRRVDRAARHAAGARWACATCACACRASAAPTAAQRLPRAPAGAPAREREQPLRGGARADRAEPAARVRLRPRGHAGA